MKVEFLANISDQWRRAHLNVVITSYWLRLAFGTAEKVVSSTFDFASCLGYRTISTKAGKTSLDEIPYPPIERPTADIWNCSLLKSHGRTCVAFFVW